MKNIIVSLVCILALSIYGCSSDNSMETGNTGQSAMEESAEVSQAETMEEIWASELDPIEKAKRVQELLARSNN